MSQLPAEGTRVRVWVNLHNAKRGLPQWSVGDPKTGKVLCNVHSVTLVDAEPKVSEATYRRIHRLGRRKVYARIEGRIAPSGRGLELGLVEIHLNPWRGMCFTLPDGTEYRGSEVAHFPQGAPFFMAGGAR